MEEKPDVTYADVGGCKEQIDKLREVVETPLLHVSLSKEFHVYNAVPMLRGLQFCLFY